MDLQTLKTRQEDPGRIALQSEDDGKNESPNVSHSDPFRGLLAKEFRRQFQEDGVRKDDLLLTGKQGGAD